MDQNQQNVNQDSNKSQNKKQKGPSQFEIALDIVKSMNGDPAQGRRKKEPFPQKFYLHQPSRGVFEILDDIGNDVVVQTSDSAVMAAVQKYVTSHTPFDLLPNKIKEIVELWKQLTEPLKEEPELVRQLSEPGLCWHRMPFDISENGDTPLFDEFLARCSNAEALKAAIGSLFFKEAMNQNYVWLYGDGFNGKGALMSLIARAFGPAHWSQSAPPNINDKHFVANFEHRRVVIFPDCNAKAFPASGLFKSLTGGDIQTIDRKFKTPYTATLNCIYFFSSNEMPTLSSEKADIRRAILVEVGPIEGMPEASYKQQLWKEAAFIFGKCVATYKSLCPDHGTIPKDDHGLSVMVDELEEDYATVANKYLQIRSGDKKSLVPAQLMKSIQDLAFKGDKTEYLKFLGYLRRKHKVSRIQKKINGKNMDYYLEVAWRGGADCRILSFEKDLG